MIEKITRPLQITNFTLLYSIYDMARGGKVRLSPHDRHFY